VLARQGLAADDTGVPEGYRPAEYWAHLLESDFTLRGVGHVCYSEGYNVWMYRWKRGVFRKALHHVPKPCRALDIGSGVGWVVSELLDWGAQPEGCDITDVSVERLAQRFPTVPFSKVELGREPLPHATASFDLVTILDVTFHIVDDDKWGAGVAEMARVLRPGGHLIVTDGFGRADIEPWEHVRFRSLERWRATARAAGLELTSLVPMYRWLSRDVSDLWLKGLPGRARGTMEYALELAVRRPPHMRCATFTKIP